VAAKRLKQLQTATPANAALLRYRVAASRYLDRVAYALAGNPNLLGRRLDAAAEQLLRAARPAGRSAQQHARSELERIFGKRIPASKVGDAAVLEAFVGEQRRLLSRLNADIVARAVQGDPLAALRLAEWRAKLIATDQVYKIAAESQSYYAIQAGSRSYIWLTRADERVRPGHARLHRTRQRWNRPPVTGAHGNRNHPGMDIACRCVAVPALPVNRGR
jgi:SPP1 gp7 family putative phage head morphogenesis protein